MKKSGFTLIELLAVIAILAIILVISIPKILDVIETSKINTLKNTVKLIADSAEKKYTENEAFGEENEITCDSVSKLNKEDYNKCTIIFDENGIAKVSILGRGKFKGLKVIEATKTSAEVIKLEAPKYGITAVEYINVLYEYDSDTNNLKIDNTKDQNVRYYGSDPNNYVSFNNELWRIIGVFGNNVKLVRKDSLGGLSWDTSESTINNGNGINQWGESTYEDGTTYEGSDLMQYLNKMYYGGDTTVTCYNSFNNVTTTCPKNSKGNFLTIDGTSKSLIDNHTWNTGAIKIAESTDTLLFYQAERGMVSGKSSCSDRDNCNDNVIRTTEWTGYVALPYVTDWAYASSESVCETNMQAQDSSNTYICRSNNWIYSKYNVWYLAPYAAFGFANASFFIHANGKLLNRIVSADYNVFPALYLKSNVKIESGNGTSSNPYILKLGN